LLELWGRASLINPTFTRDNLVKAIRDPKKAIKVLLVKMKNEPEAKAIRIRHKPATEPL
jgi:hypothetical protein